MQVAPIPDLDPEINDVRIATANIVNRYIIPNEEKLADYRAPETQRLRHEIQEVVKKAELWAPHLPKEYGGMGIGFMKHAFMNEILAWSPFSNSLFGVVAPDSGNQTILIRYGTEEQKKKWLDPLIAGEIRSCFSMTEPDAPGSNPYAIQTRAIRDGDEWVINGRKWFISNAADPRTKIFIVMGQTSPDRPEAHRRQSMILVPRDTPGLSIVRNPPVMHERHPQGHCEVLFENVRVPADNLLGEEGGGFALAQARLGPGRIHHCMRAIGAAEVALELMIERSLERRTFGQMLHEHGTIREWIALSRIEIEQARLLVLKAAWLMDKYGNKAARREVSLIKVIVPRIEVQIANRAMQTFGAKGLTQDTPLPDIWTHGRYLQIVDGPDEVHLRSIARAEVRAVEQRRNRPH
jgi:acyl-CoA dehydrogenase